MHEYECTVTKTIVSACKVAVSTDKPETVAQLALDVAKKTKMILKSKETKVTAIKKKEKA